jgi:hypothetical protein
VLQAKVLKIKKYYNQIRYVQPMKRSKSNMTKIYSYRVCVCVRARSPNVHIISGIRVYSNSQLSFPTFYVSCFLEGHYKARTFGSCPKFSKRYFELQFNFKFQNLIDAILLQNLKDMGYFNVDLVHFGFLCTW